MLLLLFNIFYLKVQPLLKIYILRTVNAIIYSDWYIIMKYKQCSFLAIKLTE